MNRNILNAQPVQSSSDHSEILALITYTLPIRCLIYFVHIMWSQTSKSTERNGYFELFLTIIFVQSEAFFKGRSHKPTTFKSYRWMFMRNYFLVVKKPNVHPCFMNCFSFFLQRFAQTAMFCKEHATEDLLYLYYHTLFLS